MKPRSIFIMTLTLTLLLCGSATAFDARSSAVVPGMRVKGTGSSCAVSSYLWVTNITGSDVTCRVTVYDHAGDDLTSYSRIYTGSQSTSSTVVIDTGTGTFDLPAGETRLIGYTLTVAKNTFGYGVIEWSSSDPLVRKPLIAVGEVITSNGRKLLPVNNGQPF